MAADRSDRSAASRFLRDLGPYPPPGAGPDTDQGWDDQTTRSWYHADQGTAFFPYAWLLALEQADGRELFTAPDNLRRFGFLPDPPHPSFNPDGLPVGFSRTTIAIDRPPFSCWQGEWVGLTCAACHTGELRYQGAAIRIEGGPAQNDIEASASAWAVLGRGLRRPSEGAALRRPRADRGRHPALTSASLQCFDEGRRGAAAPDRGGARGRRRAADRSRLRPPRCARARRQLPVRGKHRHRRQLQADHRAGELPGAVGHAVLRLGALQQFRPPAARAQHRRGAGRRRADRSPHAERAGPAARSPARQHHRHPAVAAGPEVAASGRRRSSARSTRIWRPAARRSIGANCVGCHQLIDRDSRDAAARRTSSRSLRIPIDGGRHRSAPGGQLRHPRDHARRNRPSRSARGSSWSRTRSSTSTSRTPRTRRGPS